ncbi:hypothetical protein Ahy_B10g101896 [Arachis hypogaea]|uniref:Uncharacterized protein n=1 Tax=Arachis hypogaea TaxID=3818 RepID=A0A444X0Q4_ARAHY|nr:hypothetical protein Ahy_B10g101896 [Arachis hypogaea]
MTLKTISGYAIPLEVNVSTLLYLYIQIILWTCFPNTEYLTRHQDRVQSEYAVTNDDARNGTLFGALAEAAFLIGLERNRLGVFCSLLILGRSLILQHVRKHVIIV